VSLFSGCGLSDFGYRLAGFEFLAHVEKDPVRAEIGQRNFPQSQWFSAAVEEAFSDVVKTVAVSGKQVEVLIATPPCQGLSSSNPSRGKRCTEKAWRNAEKNRLLLQIVPYVRSLKPRVVIAENVRQVLTHRARKNGRVLAIPDFLEEELPDYQVFPGVVNVADYGVPQVRRRAIIVAVKRTEPWLDTINQGNLLPWPRPTHAEHASNNSCPPWITIRRWFRAMSYERLSACSEDKATGTHALHFVPAYDDERFALVSNIPKFKGGSAYENSDCPSCGRKEVPPGKAVCPACRARMFNRPIVQNNGRVRLVKGFDSSYRRMPADRPASTVTTNSSHIGSDNKIHPWEHRVLSILECADLQTVPRCFDWSFALETKRNYLVRNLVGEAFPPYFTYLHGKVIRDLLLHRLQARSQLAVRDN
jgi:DNA (cytosine-5)-methyltransferase 1